MEEFNTYGLELRAELKKTRKTILDLLESVLSDNQKWPFIRSRVLTALGKSGFEGFLDHYLNSSKQNIDNNSIR